MINLFYIFSWIYLSFLFFLSLHYSRKQHQPLSLFSVRWFRLETCAAHAHKLLCNGSECIPLYSLVRLGQFVRRRGWENWLQFRLSCKALFLKRRYFDEEKKVSFLQLKVSQSTVNYSFYFILNYLKSLYHYGTRSFIDCKVCLNRIRKRETWIAFRSSSKVVFTVCYFWWEIKQLWALILSR